MGMRLKHTLYHKDQDRLYWRGKWNGYMMTALRSSRPVQFLQWKREPRNTTSTAFSILGHVMGVPTLIVYHRDCRGSVGLNNWESDCDGEEGRGLQQSAHGLGRPSSYLQCPCSNPNQWLCWSAEPNQGCTLTWELGRYSFAWFRSSNEEFCQL